MKKYVVTILVVLTFAGLALAGCNKNNTETTPSEQIKQGAQQVGQGVKSAANKVADYASDAAITTHVKARLAANQGLSSFNIHVETENGIVSLTGTVDQPAQRELAGKVASNTEGVKGVNNYIKVKELKRFAISQ